MDTIKLPYLLPYDYPTSTLLVPYDCPMITISVIIQLPYGYLTATLPPNVKLHYDYRYHMTTLYPNVWL